jgi:hypothetical protein
MDPATTAYSKIFAFMLPLNRETQCGCKLCLVGLLGEWFANSHSDSLLRLASVAMARPIPIR